ncbi:hypothetical protein ACHWUR_00480, partial [Klebsiella pneumoniae]
RLREDKGFNASAPAWTTPGRRLDSVIFLGAVLCAFCLWEGRSCPGLQRTGRAFRPFEERLHQGSTCSSSM